eukprot:7268416-Prymnesium_polylepis.1
MLEAPSWGVGRRRGEKFKGEQRKLCHSRALRCLELRFQRGQGLEVMICLHTNFFELAARDR